MGVNRHLSMLDDDEREWLAPFLVGIPGSGGEWRAYCPICEDPDTSKSPSAGFNFKKGYWHCLKSDCEQKAGGGKIQAFIRHLKQYGIPKRRAEVIDIKTKEKVSKEIPSDATVEQWHKLLLSQPHLLERFMNKRGLELKTIKARKIGWHHNTKRYTIPVYDSNGDLIAVKGYRMGQRIVRNKMIFIPGGHVSLYNEATLNDNDEVAIVEGELDSLTLEQRGIPAVGHTAGANGWRPEWAAKFKGKIVYIIPDEDKIGQEGADKISKSLDGIAKQAYMVNLGTGKPKADVTDFLVDFGFTVRDLRKRFAEARETPLFATPDETPTTGIRVTLQESQAPSAQTLELDMQVIGKLTPPYLAPKEYLAQCSMNKGKVCDICPMKRRGGEYEVTVQPNDPTNLLFIDANEAKVKAAMVRQVDAKCNDRIDFVVKEEWSLEQLQVSESTEDVDPSQIMTPLAREMFSVGTYQTDTNIFATALAMNTADPRTSRGTLLAWRVEPRQSRIDDFMMTPKLRKELSIFQADTGQDPLEKCMEIAHDIAHNVTRIYGRDLMHVAMDLVWHSAVGFDLASQYVRKGWLEALIIGDTRTGKSEIAQHLSRHYNAGVVHTCEGASFAGLVGGAQQVTGKSWMVTWGAIPLNDRRLVVLDEMSGLKDKGIIEQMSSIRSEGVAQLTKIASHKTSARTRLLWISNPADGKTIVEVPGMEAMRRLVTSPEDIARFDFAMAASNNEVPARVMNSTKRSNVPHTHTRQLCRALVLWAWSRQPEHVRWGAGAEESIMAEAQKLGQLYASDPPLVQAANIRVKLARLAVAIAARTFATDTSGELIIVRRTHVHAAVRFLGEVYGTDSMGYLRHSRRLAEERSTASKNIGKADRYIREAPDLAEMLYAIGDDHFRIQDFEGLASLDGSTALRQLLSWHMVRRIKRGFYAKEPALVELLRRMEDE